MRHLTRKTSNDFNDILEWSVSLDETETISETIDVNSYHDLWILAETDGVEIQGFTPALIETTEILTAPGDADLTVEIDLTATNIGDGALPSTVMVGLLPVDVTDNKVDDEIVATGVDSVSKTANESDPGYQEDFWIMAPLQGPGSFTYENLSEVKIGMGTGDVGELTSGNATPDSDTESETNVSPDIDLDGEHHEVLWQGTGNGIDSEEVVKLRINGDQTGRDLPIKVKTMKYREVTVIVYPVRKSVSMRNVPLPEDDPNDLKDLKNYLNTVYGYQLNVWFNVQYEDQTEFPYDPDENGIVGVLDSSITELFGHQAYQVDPKHIRIVLFDSVEVRDLNVNLGFTYAGYSYPDLETAIISTGNGTSSDPSKQAVRETISHEIGHIFGLGHPDQEEDPAALEGTDRTDRLMCSTDPAAPRKVGAKLLVKKEWDTIENRLKANLGEEQ